MFINPDDRRVGNRRQQLTRQKIAAQLDNENRRRRGMSRFAQTGQDRLARGRRAPLRGMGGTGPRMADVGRAGGLAQFLGGRVPGNPNARIPVEPPAVAPPRIGPPTPPPQLPGDLAGRRGEQPIGLDRIRDLFSDERTALSLSGSTLEELMGPQRFNPALSPALRDQLLSGGPTTMASAGIDLAGLIPLGGGTWFDPASGQIHGAGNQSNYAL